MRIPKTVTEIQRLVLATVGVCLALFWMTKNLDPAQAIDFGVYWEAVQRTSAGLSAYQSGIHLQYKYSPGTTSLFWFVFHQLDLAEALFRFRVASVILWAVALICFFRKNFWHGTLIFLICAPSIAEEFKLGQINIVPLILWIGPAVLQKKTTTKSDGWVGLLLAVAVGIKLYVALWLPVLFFSKRWRLLAITLTSGLMINFFLPMASLGLNRAIEENWSWLVHLTSSSSDLLDSRYNASLIGVLAKLAMPEHLVKAIWLIAVLGWVYFLYRKSCGQTALWNLGYTGIAILILNPLVWSYWVWLMVPALFWAMNFDFTGSEKKRIALGVISLLVCGWSHQSHFARDGALLITSIGWAWLLIQSSPLPQLQEPSLNNR